MGGEVAVLEVGLLVGERGVDLHQDEPRGHRGQEEQHQVRHHVEVGDQVELAALHLLLLDVVLAPLDRSAGLGAYPLSGVLHDQADWCSSSVGAASRVNALRSVSRRVRGGLHRRVRGRGQARGT